MLETPFLFLKEILSPLRLLFIFSYHITNMVSKHYFEVFLDENLIGEICIFTQFVMGINGHRALFAI